MTTRDTGRADYQREQDRLLSERNDKREGVVPAESVSASNPEPEPQKAANRQH